MLGANHQHVVELPLALRDATSSVCLDLRPSFRHSFALRARTFSLSESTSLLTSSGVENFFRVHPMSSLMKKGTLMVLLKFIGVARVVVGAYTDGEPLVGRALSGLSVKHVFQQIL